MKITNSTQIRAEDFSNDDKDMIDKLGNMLNPFIQQVVDLADGRIDFDNRIEKLRDIEVTLDSNGKPLLNDKFVVGLNRVRGIVVIRAYNMSNPTVTATQQPFVSFNQISQGYIQISNITGLQANNKYRLTIIVY